MLVVDDERLNRMVIARSLERQFDVVEASDGTEALERVAAGGIDLVVIDIHMPDMDGYELTQQIKWMNPGMFLPVVLMTANNDEELFARGLTDGADDFLAKPITPSLLEAKIKALLRVGEILQEQRDRAEELNRWRARAEQDFGVAQKLFEHIAERGRFDFPDLDIRALSLEAFNGDIVLAAPLGKGRLRLLVGDFAGHGLGAALGAMPVSDVFYAMTRRRFPIEAVVREIGGKLYRMFPRHQFLAAAVADIDTVAEKALVWNGGLPASVALDAGGRIVGRAPSRHLALGVQSARDLVPQITELPLPLGGRLVLYTDGLIEARSPSGESFGDERLERLLSETTGDDWFASLWSSFETFQDGTPAGRRHHAGRPAPHRGAARRAGHARAQRRARRRERDLDPPRLRPHGAARAGSAGAAAHPASRRRRRWSRSPPSCTRSRASCSRTRSTTASCASTRRSRRSRAASTNTTAAARPRCASSPADRSPWCSRCCPSRAAASPRSGSPTTAPASPRTCCAPCAIPRRARAAACRWCTELGAELRILDGGHTVEALFPLNDA